MSVECSPEIDDPVPDSTGQEESVSNKLKMADGSGMASEVLEGGTQGQTHTHLRKWTHTCTYVRTHPHTRIRGARGEQRGGKGGHLPPSRLLKSLYIVYTPLPSLHFGNSQFAP